MALRRLFANYRGDEKSLDGRACTIAAITSAYADTDDDTTLGALAPGAESAVVARASATFAWDDDTKRLKITPATVTVDATGEPDVAGWEFADTLTGKVVSLLRYEDGGVAAPQVGHAGMVIAPPLGGTIAIAGNSLDLEARLAILEAVIDGGSL
ncbi:hypothetical protein KSP35_13010 [Aquihabitans sp. G128]|uniref:hypothetical protein n=1 Tax=Aquihabitans sp. G128 TaxID=2849779 RepID=UPI001C2437DB|nr:hypothetical protein [Aquihabitans sp. G128]QXC59322.1 hypothetical protein KSP35_13010 [Aquihabitans sp. G128]